MGASHPEQPARLDAIEERLVDSGLDAEISRHEAPKVAREQLLAAHDPRYIELVYEVAPEEGMVWPAQPGGGRVCRGRRGNGCRPGHARRSQAGILRGETAGPPCGKTRGNGILHL
jgi:acetoin utilization deacetylase AcuC-like enzyme